MLLFGMGFIIKLRLAVDHQSKNFYKFVILLFSYGYPDDDYLTRVQEEMAVVKINKEMLDQGIRAKIPTIIYK